MGYATTGLGSSAPAFFNLLPNGRHVHRRGGPVLQRRHGRREAALNATANDQNNFVNSADMYHTTLKKLMHLHMKILLSGLKG